MITTILKSLIWGLRMLGKSEIYKVLRKTDIGYLLTRDSKEYFLHFNDSNFRELTKGDLVEAFLYLDKMKREALTLYKPTMTIDSFGFGTIVKDDKTHAFVDIGIRKDIFLSKDKLFRDQKFKVGGKVFGKLIVKDNDLLVSLASKEELKAFKKPLVAVSYGYVYRIVLAGISLITEDLQVVFIPSPFLKSSNYLIGEKIGFKNLEIDDGDFIAEEEKENDDVTILLTYFKSHKNSINLTDHTDSKIIERELNISKRRFKIALGKLYKEGLVLLKENKTILKERNESHE